MLNDCVMFVVFVCSMCYELFHTALLLRCVVYGLWIVGLCCVVGWLLCVV